VPVRSIRDLRSSDGAVLASKLTKGVLHTATEAKMGPVGRAVNDELPKHACRSLKL